MTTLLPTHTVPSDEAGTTRLWFRGKLPPTGEYRVSGGICWPMPTIDGGIKGFAVVVGRHALDKCVYWLDERRFASVEHITDGRDVTCEGLAPWLCDAWRKWGCRDWYYRQTDIDLAWRYVNQVQDSRTISPKPTVDEVRWEDEQHPVTILRELQAADRIAMPNDSDVFKVDVTFSASAPGSPVPAELLALYAALVGMDQNAAVKFGPRIKERGAVAPVLW